jgi:hypothetical protein
MREGHQMSILKHSEATQESIMLHATGQRQETI